MTSHNTGIILIHGAGLGSYIWDELSPLLDLPSLALDFPNREQGNEANKDLTFEDYLLSAVNQCGTSDFNNFCIVTHSIGGLIGLRLAQHFGDRIKGFIALGAAIPRRGGSFTSCLPFPQNMLMPVLLRLAGTKAPASAIRSGLCTDIDEEQTQQIIDRFTTEARALFVDNCGATIPTVPKLYVKFAKDPEFSLKTQKQMAANLEATHIEQLECGHLPMLSHPKETAAILNTFCTG